MFKTPPVSFAATLLGEEGITMSEICTKQKAPSQRVKKLCFYKVRFAYFAGDSNQLKPNEDCKAINLPCPLSTSTILCPPLPYPSPK